MVFLDEEPQKVFMDDGTRMADIMRNNFSFSESILWQHENRKLLIVDDTEFNRITIRHFLKFHRMDHIRSD